MNADERRWTWRLGWLAMALSVLGVVLNNCRLWPCFLLWMASNAISAMLHARRETRIWSLFVRDLVFLALSVVGLWQWTR